MKLKSSFKNNEKTYRSQHQEDVEEIHDCFRVQKTLPLLHWFAIYIFTAITGNTISINSYRAPAMQQQQQRHMGSDAQMAEQTFQSHILLTDRTALAKQSARLMPQL